MADRGAAGPFSTIARLAAVVIAIVLEASDTARLGRAPARLLRGHRLALSGLEPRPHPERRPGRGRSTAGSLGRRLPGRPAAGCGGVKRLDASSAELKRIYLADEARGHGLGRRILEQLEQHARDLGYERLRLNTGDRQPQALGLFQSAGYQQIPDYNGNTWATYWMEKRL